MFIDFGVLVVSLTFVANLIIAFLVYSKNPRSASNILLSLLAFVLMSWTVSNYLALLPGEEGVRLFWVRAVMFVTSPMGPLIYLFAATYPDKKITIDKNLYFFVLLSTAIVAGLSLTPYVFSNLQNLPDGGFTLKPGWGIVLYGLNLMGFLTWGFVKLIQNYRRANGMLRKQLGSILWGIVLSFSLMVLTNFIAVVIFNSIKLTFLGPPFTLIMIGFMAYAIVKHKFLDMRLVIARTLSYAFLLFVVGLIYVVSFYLLGTLLQSIFNTYAATTIQIIITLFIAFTFETVRKRLEKITDRIFFQSVPDQDEFLREIGDISSSTLSPLLLASNISRKIMQDFHTEKVKFIVRNSDNNFEPIYQNEEDNVLNNEICRWFVSNTEQFFLVEDITDENIRRFFRDKLYYLIIRFATKEKLLGYMLIGDKKSGSDYLTQELSLLELIASNISVALNNTLQFSEIQRFNVKLEEEVKKATTDLRSANERLIEMDKRKDEFLSMAAHELRAPLTAIKGYVSMILEGDTGEVPPKAREFLADTTVINERLIRLVNNMLNVSRIEENRMVYQLEEENLSRIAQMVFSVFKVEAERKSLGYKLEIPQDLRDRVQVDSDKLQEVIGNLVSNAIKYTESGSITIKLSQASEAVRLEVIDTGPGISKEEQAKLFQKFYRVESAVGKTTGTGLGLYISKLIVEKFNGRIGVESDSGKGSRFWIEIPLAK